LSLIESSLLVRLRYNLPSLPTTRQVLARTNEPVMRLGLSSYAYGWAVARGRFDESTLLDRAREQGLSLVQFGDHIPLVNFGCARIDWLGERAQAENITLEMGARGLTADNLQRHIALAQRLDSSTLRFVIDAPGFEPPPGEVARILRDSVSHLEDLWITVGLENHDRFPAQVLRDIIEAVDSPRVGVCLDTANSLGAGEGLAHVAQVLAPVTVSLHLKDFQIRRVPYLMGFEVAGCVAGTGMLGEGRPPGAPGVEDLVRAVAESGRCGSAVLETWVPPESEIEATLIKEEDWARQSVEYLRSLGILAL
jgi:sugar phosphate isomerase/epimerase